MILALLGLRVFERPVFGVGKRPLSTQSGHFISRPSLRYKPYCFINDANNSRPSVLPTYMITTVPETEILQPFRSSMFPVVLQPPDKCNIFCVLSPKPFTASLFASSSFSAVDANGLFSKSAS